MRQLVEISLFKLKTKVVQFHAVRRRQVSDAFSMNSVKKMEPLLNQNISFLRLKLDSASKACSAICLKDCFAYYMVDVLGELAFSQSFGVQMSDNPNPPRTIEHILLSNIMGLVPNLMPFLKKITPWVPIPWVQNCVATRIALKKIAVDCVGKRLEKSQPDRTDILSYLVNARDPETGAKLSEDEINTEAFGLMYVPLQKWSDKTDEIELPGPIQLPHLSGYSSGTSYTIPRTLKSALKKLTRSWEVWMKMKQHIL